MKRLLALFLVLVILVTALPTIVASAAAYGSTQATAITVQPTSSGNYTFNNPEWGEQDLWFKVTLPSRGVLNFNCTKLADVSGKVDSIYFYLYKSVDTSSAIWSDDSWTYEDIFGNYNFNIPLDKGTYYFQLDTSLYDKYRNLEYAFKFTANSNYEMEPNNGPNAANAIALNKTMNGYTGSSEDYYALTVTKNTKVRLKIGNYATLSEKYVTMSITFADKKTEYIYDSKVVSEKGYAYIDVLMKKGTNIITIGRERPGVKYYLCPSTSISYSAPTIKKVEKKASYGKYIDAKIYWNEVKGTDGYEFYMKTGNGSYELQKDLSWYTDTGISIWNLIKTKSYQVRIRAYKLFGTTKHYSDWSKVIYIVPTPTNIKLSATTYTYNGKTKTPSVTIKDANGKKLVKNTDYTVKYSSGRKKVGTYKVTITFKGKYSGKVTKSFKIVPKGTTVSKTTAAKKAIKVVWKKQKTQTSGYQVQTCLSSKFKSGVKTVTIKKNTTTSTTVKGLKAKKTYYVRVRTYKTINGVKYYSSWSKVAKRVTK